MSCCCCSQPSGITGGAGGNLPLICLVPRDPAASKAAGAGQQKGPTQQAPSPSRGGSDVQFLDEEYLRKHFNFPQRALYLDPFRKPLITFPISGEKFSKHFNIDRKAKINQQILDGFLDPSEAITAPSVFPYAKTDADKKKAEEEEEIIYILQLPDWEFKCPVHNETITTPSPLAKPGFDALDISKPVLMQMNPDGKWERKVPENIEEEMLKSVVQQLINTKALSAAKTFCSQCATDAQRLGGKSNYVPIIMMPLNGISTCPFDDIECESQTKKEREYAKYAKGKDSAEKHDDEEKQDTKPKKRPFVLQRLTDFDLMSQW